LAAEIISTSFLNRYPCKRRGANRDDEVPLSRHKDNSTQFL
jgi:hypothetical protein